MKKVALIVDTNLPLSRDLLRGVVQYANTHGGWSFYHIREQLAGRILSCIERWRPDGMIIRIRRIPKEIQQMRIPVIANSHVQKAFAETVNLIGEETAIGNMGAEYFLNKGFRNYAFFGIRYQWSRNRYHAFQNRLRGFGHHVHLYESSIGRFERNYGEELTRLSRWLKTLPKPLALMIPSDDCGQYVTEACKLARIMVPSEIAVLGVHNDDIVCDSCFPPLSSIALDSRGAGYNCAKLLDTMMSNPGGRFEKSVPVVPTHVVTRQSTNIMAISDRDVISALEYIHNNRKRMIQVNDVASHVGISAKTLQRKFRSTVGHSVHKEITLTRIEYIVKALIESDMTISEIARVFGYDDVSNFSRYFKKIKGVCPRDYRRKHYPAKM